MAAKKSHEGVAQQPTGAELLAQRLAQPRYSRGKFTAFPCPCPYYACRAWLVSPVADVQSVSFTREQAVAVVDTLAALGDE